MFEARGDQVVHIVGAGPAGLAGALTVAHAGRQAVIHEQRSDVGGRFHGDLQAVENWTTNADALEELAAMGIKPNLGVRAFHEVTFFDPTGREYPSRSSDPLFYLVRRGPGSGTLDTALKQQALSAGVEIRFREPCARLPEGGIVAGGPRAADAIAIGFTFETDRADAAFGVLSESLAPKGYAYLLICGGRGTVATCLFDDFHREKMYLERTVEFFQRRAGLAMREPVRFGGAGNVMLPKTARQGGILFAGEAAGFQDALWGFGIRIGMLSGHLAARALLARCPESYDRAWRKRLGGVLKTSLVNRYAFARMGDRGYAKLVRSIGRMRDTRRWLFRHYSPSVAKVLLYPLARCRVRSRRGPPGCGVATCDCTWCRLGHTAS